jgi:hypothetical protein
MAGAVFATNQKELALMITFVPLTFLRDLREECLAHSEKRMPKWKFRLAPDLVMQLQPKPMYLPTPRQIESGIKIRLLQFDGVAIQVGTGTASAELFNNLHRSAGGSWWRRTFEIIAYNEDEWHYQPRHWRCTRRGRGVIPALDERIAVAFTHSFFTNLVPDALLGSHGLICGKGLTDPASMARRIGPECAGTSSLVVPFILTPKVA